MATQFLRNLALLTDSYKSSHWKQYPPETEYVYSYFESRGGPYDSTVFYGLQYFIKEYMTRIVTMEDVERANKRWPKHGTPFNYEGWKRIVEVHKGKVPLEIKAVPEGTVVPTGNVLMTVVNTDPELYWLTNWFETLLVEVWYPCTVATQSRYMKQTILKYLEKTGGDTAGVDFMLHDFGFRGVSCPEQAALGGSAHLLNFLGTDTAPGFELHEFFYHEDMAGFSIPASEHSTITTWGKDGEYDAFANMLDQYPTGIMACVSDSFDIVKACQAWSSEPLKSRILNREGKLVVRPDSGHPPTSVLKVLNTLAAGFGFTRNEKGYKMLPPQVGVIQGDGIDPAMLETILDTMEKHEWCASNLAFGSGGGLLQKVDRDTCKYAFKCSEVTFKDGSTRDVFKSPIDAPDKASKKGRFSLVKDSDLGYVTIPEGDCGDQLATVFLNGELKVDQYLADIRERVKC